MTAVITPVPNDKALWDEVSKMLWEAAINRGVRIPERNEAVLQHNLKAHAECFGNHFLVRVPNARCTKGALQSEIRTKKAPILQERDVVSVDQIDSIVYGWTCVFLLSGFRGVTQKGTPEVLRSEALWFLDALGYTVDPPHEVFRLPFRQTCGSDHWEKLCFNDSMLGNSPSAVPVQVPPSDICKKCPLRRPGAAHCT